jgi:hypothetical protein
MGVHVQCICAKKLVSSNFAKIMHNYVWKKKMLSRLAVSGNVWGGSTSSDILAVHNYDLKKKTYSFLEVSIGDTQEHQLGVCLGKELLYFNIT